MRISAALAGVVAAALGLCGYAGWILGVPSLASWLPQLPAMLPNTAAALILAGMALALKSARTRRPDRAPALAGLAAFLALLIGLGNIAEYLFRWDFIDSALIPGEVPAMPYPDRAPPYAAVAISLLAGAILLLDRPKPAVAGRLSEGLANAGGLVALLALLGYLYQVAALFSLTRWTGMALPAAAGLLCLAVGVILARPDQGLARRLAETGPGSVMYRRLLPYAIAVPVLVGLMYDTGRRLGIAYHPAAIAAYAVVLMAASIWVVGRTASLLDRLEEERRRAASAERYLAAIVRSSDDAITGKTLDGVITSWNEGAERLYGYSREQAIGKNIEMLEPASQIGESRGLLERIQAGQHVDHFETTRIRKDGTPVAVSLSLSPIRDDQDRIVGASVIARDVTQRVRDEQAIREGLANLRELLEASPDPIVIVAMEGPILMVNRRFEEDFGYKREEVLGQDFHILVPECFRERHREYHEDYVRKPVTRQMGQGRVLAAQRKDGTVFPADISLSPARFGGREVVISTIRDARARLEYEEASRKAEELERSRQMARIKEHLLSSFSHELRTPLSALKGYSELLEDKLPGDPLVGGILEGADRLATLVNNLVDYNALVSGSLELFRGEVEVEEAVDLALGHAREGFVRKGVILIKDVSPDLPQIAGDSRRIAQILGELLDNARKFTDPGGTAGVRARRRDGEVQIDVWDTGRGIATEDQVRIWEALTQLDLGDALRTRGVGLGLPIAKKLAELHGGRITLASKPGKGSTFSVFLPAREEGPGERAGGHARPAARDGRPTDRASGLPG